tara:strand:+ start:512 stop:859 length:348 start_codon:yes stop_codon:yes gene_type:complete
MEEKFLSIYLTVSTSRSLISTKDVVAVEMATTQTVKIWYKGGRTIVLELNAVMAANNNDVSDFLANEIAQSHYPVNPQSTQANLKNPLIFEIATPFPDILNAAGGTVTITSMTIA